jgi:hypothetical protein
VKATRTLAGVIVAFVVGACGNPDAPALPYKGILRLSWTLQGQTISDATCADIDHLVITVQSTPSLGVKIEPVRCVAGLDWERDDVPEGTDVVLVDAIDGSGRNTLEAVATLGVTQTRAGTPAPVDLTPP